MPPEGWIPAGYKAKALSDEEIRNMEKSISVREALKTKQFWLMFSCFTLLVWTYSFISSYTTVFITDFKGLSPVVAVTAVSFMGIGSASGRFIGGAVVDKIGVKSTYFFMCSATLLSLFLFLKGQSDFAMIFAFAVLAFGYGGKTPVYGVMYVWQFGPKFASTLYGYGVLGTIITSLVGSIVTSVTRNATGSYDMTIIIAIIIDIIGFTCMMVLPKAKPVDALRAKAE